MRRIDVARLRHLHELAHDQERVGTAQVYSSTHQVNLLTVDRNPVVIVFYLYRNGFKC